MDVKKIRQKIQTEIQWLWRQKLELPISNRYKNWCGGYYTNFFSKFFPFSEFMKCCFPIIYHIHIWQISLQPSCGDTCQIWTRFKGLRRHFPKMKNVCNGEINKGKSSYPHPWNVQPYVWNESFNMLRQTHNVMMTSSLCQNDVVTSFWRNNEIIIMLCICQETKKCV